MVWNFKKKFQPLKIAQEFCIASEAIFLPFCHFTLLMEVSQEEIKLTIKVWCLIIKGMGKNRLRIGMAQINATVGDISGNSKKIVEFIHKAKGLGVELLTFPELSITGYPPEDLLLKPQFVKDNMEAMRDIIRKTMGIGVIAGFVDSSHHRLFNAASVMVNGRLSCIYHKIHLPNYGVFDEKRYFYGGNECLILTFNGISIGFNICEDIWCDDGPTELAAIEGGAQIIINISASPYHAGKMKLREELLIRRATSNKAIVCYNNLVGGQDELVFDGGSMIISPKGEVSAYGQQFEEDLVVYDLDIESVLHERLREKAAKKAYELGYSLRKVKLEGITAKKKPVLPVRGLKKMGHVEEVYNALVLGTRDYVRKNGFKKVVIGLSGGIDSALTAVVAVDALGPDNVVGISMPSQYSSPGTKLDAEKLAGNLNIRFITIPIDRILQSYLDNLKSEFAGLEPSEAQSFCDVAEENLQARIRGNILMAFSNKFGWLVLTTGNKSEMGVGYCTLYGDMAGGFAVIKDVPKTYVYTLTRWRNRLSNPKKDRPFPFRIRKGSELIPESVIQRPPSAELRPNQKDEDSIPPYPILDPILKAYVEEDKSYKEMRSAGFKGHVLRKIIRLVDKSEYKRRQGPPGIKITPKAFGKDRRMPITNRYREF